MRISDFGRYALSSCVAAALFAGCGGSQPPIGAPDAVSQSVRTATSSHEVLYRFNGHANGGEPLGRLLDVKGTLYGTTSQGGTGPCSHGCGTVYSISPTGGVSLLFSFDATDGRQPASAVIDVKGTLYGTTVHPGNGIVYSITTAGVETTLYSFKGHPDGRNPDGNLIDVKGTLYGTTGGGGDSRCGRFGCGVVYSVTTSGEENVLYRFKGGSDGDGPNALIYINGMLYGTTAGGGAGTGCGTGSFAGCGTFYSLSLSGKHKVLYSFGGGSDGESPHGELISVNGTLYGATPFGGESSCFAPYGCGTVYRITTSGAEQVLYRFAGGSDGTQPVGGLLDLNGTLYGTTRFGGATSCTSPFPFGCGTVYSVTTSGVETVLYRFAANRDGFNPMAALTDVHGSLYGTTEYGGQSKGLKKCCGTVFRLTL